MNKPEEWLIVDLSADIIELPEEDDEQVSAWIKPMSLNFNNFDPNNFEDEKLCARPECGKRANVPNRACCEYCKVFRDIRSTWCSAACMNESFSTHILICKKYSYPDK